MSEIIAAGPSTFDDVLFNRQSLKIIQCLYKASANQQLGNKKLSTRYASAAYQLIANVLWLNDEEEDNQIENSQENSKLSQLLAKV